ncbi:MAG: YbhB/YbcL family Raf kinase inhibitor-like protein [Chlamydiales bacterium]|nr:YbhB/YbcL family Raf kinase inhibitor-like protein [Chlamydiia bacterium]MCP5507677.1 YbhB/YbcL family Raf kinase inhibitor-like protein [Chlamydiales bacterium]
MKIESPVFGDHERIPDKYTCDGADISPPLSFHDVPLGCKTLAIVVDDPDAPAGTFDHWVVWNIPSETIGLTEDRSVGTMGINGFNKLTYKGPCPPKGSDHRYFFKLYALDTFIELPPGSSKEELEKAMESHIMAKAELVGTYGRS